MGYLTKGNNPNHFRIFLDLDGVVANWIHAAAKLCNIDIACDRHRRMLKQGCDLEKLGVITPDKMWDKIVEAGSTFWAELEPFPWAHDLYDSLSEVAPVCFLTSPGKRISGAAKGKTKWIQKHFGTHNTLIGTEKHFAANPNTILIDDSVKKIEMFRRWNGNVFQWPEPCGLLDGDAFPLTHTSGKKFKNIKELVNGVTEYCNQCKQDDIEDRKNYLEYLKSKRKA